VPEVADDVRRDLEFLDDLAQLAPVVEEIEDTRGDPALRQRRRGRSSRYARRLELTKAIPGIHRRSHV
jgi:hypothetical protein